MVPFLIRVHRTNNFENTHERHWKVSPEKKSLGGVFGNHGRSLVAPRPLTSAGQKNLYLLVICRCCLFVSFRNVDAGNRVRTYALMQGLSTRSASFSQADRQLLCRERSWILGAHLSAPIYSRTGCGCLYRSCAVRVTYGGRGKRPGLT